jgi:membrane-bound inhibitor of C-type lysozyme
MQGRIKFLNEREWNGKSLYSFKLENDEASYMCGGDKPNASKGDFVTFEVRQNQKGQNIVDVKTLAVKKSEVVSGAAPSAGREGYWSQREKSDDTRQSRIEWQAARNSAIALADVILKNAALKMPAKETAKYDAVVALVAELTTKFFEETKTLGAKPAAPKEPEVVINPEAPMDGIQEDWDE